MLRKLAINKRIFTLVSVSIVVFTVIILIATNYITRVTIQNRYFGDDKALQSETAKNAELLISDINLLSVRLMGNEELYHIFRKNEFDYSERLALYQSTIPALIEDTAAAEVAVVDTEGRSYSTGAIPGVFPDPDKLNYDEFNTATDHLCICAVEASISGERYICLGRRYYFYTTSADLGYLYIYLPESVLYDAISVSSPDTFSLLVTSDGLVLTASDKNKIGSYLLDASLLSSKEYNHWVLPYENHDSIYTVRYVSELENVLNTPIYSMNIYANDTLFVSVNRMIWIVVGLELILMIFAIVFCYFAARRIVKPIHKLQENLEDFGKDGNLTPSYFEGNDEFSELEKTYNEMLYRIADLTKKNTEEKLEQRKLQLDALQAQINPHFLYNTLDTIIWIAKIKKQQEIADLAMALAGFFRISLHKGDKYIHVREELDFVKGFVLIEQTRFPDKFKLVIDVSDEILDFLIFKVMIQPFVENAIKHGIAPKKGSGCITVRGQREENDLVFQVIDDGVGIQHEQNHTGQGELEGLHGYGIQNVDERIRLAFGEPYGVHIESVPGEGTTVTIRVPIHNR